MQSLLLTALMDVDVTSQSVGTLENLLTVSYEKTLIDDEVIDRVRRILQGIEIDEEMLSVEEILEVEHGQNFLTQDSTLRYLCNGWQADISDWNSYENWMSLNHTDIEQRAAEKVRDILETSEIILDKGVTKELNKYIKK